MRFAVELTPEESNLLSSIEFDHGQIDHQRYKDQGPLVLRLMQSLEKRKAIPAVRMLYWTDPEYQIGRIKASHQGLFERNGTVGPDICMHPHFLPYLRYFIFGAKLPERVIAEFSKVVGNPEWVTSGDIGKIAAGVRNLMRKHRLQSGESEEFFRLALDAGLSPLYARAVRDAAKSVK